MKKKNILVIVPTFQSGGTVTSLMNFVSLMNKDEYDINVFAISNIGVNREYVAQYCNVIGYHPGNKSASCRDFIRNKVVSIVKLIKKTLCTIGIDLSPFLFKHYASKIDNPKTDYVLAFQEGQATLFASYLKHGIKVAWVRSEFTRFAKTIKGDNQAKIYNKYDRIVSVSKASTESFLSVLPQFKDRTYTLHNFINDKRVIELSSEQVNDVKQASVFTIISIGRIDPVKRFSAIPSIVAALRERGLQIRWLIVGGNAVNEENERLLHEINVNKVEKDTILTGNKKNPYPYLKMSDLLVSLSISETFNNTLTEAKILGVPVVTTNYACASESIEDGEEGLIVPFEEITDAIENMVVNNNDIYDKIKSKLSKYKYNNEKLLDHLCEVILR